MYFTIGGIKVARKRKSNQPTHYKFESKTSTGAFTKICKDMQKSLAWQQLSLRQQRIIFTFKI